MNNCEAVVCTCSTNGLSTSTIVSVLTLAINIFFYIFVASKLDYKYRRRSEFYAFIASFLEYLSQINSMDSFDGVLTRIASDSRIIKLYYKSGEPPKDINDELEALYQSVGKRKALSDIESIKKWEEEYRIQLKNLRKHFAKHTGVF